LDIDKETRAGSGYSVGLVWVFFGCHQSYDSNTDKVITTLYKQTAEFFAEVADELGCEYQHHLPFYQNS
jgi:hypothetical protein